MCGIFGVVNFAGIVPNDLRVFEKLMYLNAKRGDRAFGMYDGQRILKYSADWVWNLDVISELEYSQGQRRIYKSNIVLGHHRAPTHGSPLDDNNNHPFKYKDLVLAHNGIILNHKELRKEFPGDNPNIVTDSYTILTCIADKAWPYVTTEGYVKAVKEALSLLKGSFACWLYSESRGVLVVFNNISPIHVYVEKDSRLVFSSEPFEDAITEPNGRLLVLDFSAHQMYTHTFKANSPYDIH
jgi:glucosamine 6-phosphate synthetase-like amidotransferase/phosphosugar isomerase protein